MQIPNACIYFVTLQKDNNMFQSIRSVDSVYNPFSDGLMQWVALHDVVQRLGH